MDKEKIVTGSGLTSYIIFACPKCGQIRYARDGQRTAKCLGCNHQIQIDPQKIKIIAKARDVRDAVELVKIYKIKRK